MTSGSDSSDSPKKTHGVGRVSVTFEAQVPLLCADALEAKTRRQTRETI